MGGDPFRTYDNLGAHPPCYYGSFPPNLIGLRGVDTLLQVKDGCSNKNPSVGEVILVVEFDAIPYNGLLSSAYLGIINPFNILNNN